MANCTQSQYFYQVSEQSNRKRRTDALVFCGPADATLMLLSSLISQGGFLLISSTHVSTHLPRMWACVSYLANDVLTPFSPFQACDILNRAARRYILNTFQQFSCLHLIYIRRKQANKQCWHHNGWNVRIICLNVTGNSCINILKIIDTRLSQNNLHCEILLHFKRSTSFSATF